MTHEAAIRRVLVVRREDLERFSRLKEKFRGLPVDIVVDRRVQGRRRKQTAWPVERRREDRRETWPLRFPSSAFIVVPAALTDDWVAPARGDALVSKLGDTHELEGYGISLLPGDVQSRYDTHDLAVERARRFAQYAAVDLWYTEDGLTFVLLAIFRRPPGRVEARASPDDSRDP